MVSLFVTVAYIALCLLLFSLAIAIHEFGHFIVALKLGLRVERFSIGFGPAIWKKTVNGVEYRLSWIPLGGYVSIPDVDPEGTKAIEGGSDNAASPRAQIPAWKELLVAFAGPFMNLVLAAVLAVVLALIPGVRFGELKAIIGSVPEEGPAAEGGLKPGDRVVSVGGRPVDTWVEMQTEVQIAGEKPTPFVIARGEAEYTLSITPRRDPVTGACFILALSQTNTTGAAMWMPDRNPLRQLAWDAGSIFRVLKGLVTPKEIASTSRALGGPVMIAEGIYAAIRRDFFDGLGFLRFLNVNLAIINLLPLPVLDGGLIFFALIALVFRRRVPAKVVAGLSMAFMYLLMGLMAILIFKDALRSWRIHTFDPQPALEESTTHDVPKTDANH